MRMESKDPAWIENLLARMTLAEKIGQLVMRSSDMAVTGPLRETEHRAGIETGAIGSLLNLWGRERIQTVQRLAVEHTRLGIPLLFGLDVLHGHHINTPVPLAEAGLFDDVAWRASAALGAREAAQDGIDLTFAPMLDVCRDPRWGRIVESPGEDPYLAARFARAKVEGLQGADLSDPAHLAATAKHLGAYGAVTAGREYASVDVSERSLHEIHLPAFEAAVRAGVAAIMPSLTDIAGIPMSANAPVLTDLVRGQWGFQGVFISDYGAVEQLIAHGVAGDLAEAAALGLRAGIDIDMMSEAYRSGLPLALERGLVRLTDVDAAVRRVLTLKLRLGLFDDPYRRCRAAPDVSERTEARGLARVLAARSIVLAKAEPDVLPLSASVPRIAVLGPLADAAGEMIGSWSAAGPTEPAVSFLEGICAAFPSSVITHAPCVPVEASADSRDAEITLAAARDADMIVLVLGEAIVMSGEASSRTEPVLPRVQVDLARVVLGTGRPVILVLVSGRPLVLPEDLVEGPQALLFTFFLGHEAGHALGDVLSGRADPAGRLTACWPTSVGQIPVYFGERRTGRPLRADKHFTTRYIDAPNAPRFTFGHGLSLARFVFGEPTIDMQGLREDEIARVRVRVTNKAGRRGEATAFLFLCDPVASVGQPLLKLRGFQRLTLAGGESADALFTLRLADLAFVGADLRLRVEPGRFDVFVGPSAAPDGLKMTSFTLPPPDAHLQARM